ARRVLHPERRVVVHPSLAATDDRDSSRGLRAHAARVPVLWALLPGELPRVHRPRLDPSPAPRGQRDTVESKARSPVASPRGAVAFGDGLGTGHRIALASATRTRAFSLVR